MKRAAVKLATFPDYRLLEEVAQGISHVNANASDLNEAAHRLHRADQLRASEIMRGMAEEEAAKVLILIDAVRCPRAKRGNTLKRFYNHLAKRIYAATSSKPSIATFGELRDLVDLHRRPHVLDGPNDVDWILGNTVLTEREQAIYVDFVQDITEPDGDYFWAIPLDPGESPRFPYEIPDALALGCALSDAGAASPEGLAVIADVWSDFIPSPNTDRDLLREIIERMLNRLVQDGLASGDQNSMHFILSHWSFPLWPLDFSPSDAAYPSIDELRASRSLIIQRLQATAAQRNPPPAVTRETVEAMDEAYAKWKSETAEYDRKVFPHRQGAGIRIRSSDEFAAWFRLPSHARLKAKLRELETDERIALLALAWFTRDRVPNWSFAFKHATDSIGRLDDDYQVGLGQHWLPGLDRWEADPPPFRVGSFFHH